MSNMSYCRFRNTLSDLRDCSENMDSEGMSYDERVARWRLIRLCGEIAMNYEDEGIEAARPKREGLEVPRPPASLTPK